MDYFTIGAVLWLAVFALLGLAGGLWRALASALGLAAACAATLYGTAPLTQFTLTRFAEARLNETFVWWLCATLIFVLAGLLARLLILTATRSLPLRSTWFNRGGGALIGTGHGAVLAVFALWSTALLADVWNARQQQLARPEAMLDTGVPVVAWSRKVMGHWTRWNLTRNGVDESLIHLSVAFAEQPAQRIVEVRDTLRSPEFQTLVNSESVQDLVREGDAAALRETAEFEQLIQQPAVRQLREELAASGAHWSDDELAERMIHAWQNIEQYREHPELAELAEDEEVQAFLQGEGRVSPALLGKAQKALALLVRQPAAEDAATDPSQP